MFAQKLDGSREHLAAVRRQYPFLPLVLVTDRQPDNLRILADLSPLDGLVFAEEIKERLLNQATVAAERTLLSRAVSHISGVAGLSEPLRQALVYACQSLQPVRSVEGVATHFFFRAPSTLRYHWHKSIGIGSTPHDFIDWLVVAHAIANATPGDTVGRLANRVNLDRHVLGPALRRRFPNATLNKIITGGLPFVLGNLQILLSPAFSCSKSNQS